MRVLADAYLSYVDTSFRKSVTLSRDLLQEATDQGMTNWFTSFQLFFYMQQIPPLQAFPFAVKMTKDSATCSLQSYCHKFRLTFRITCLYARQACHDYN